MPARSLRPRIHGTTSTGRALVAFVAAGDRMRAGQRPVQSHVAHAGEIHPPWSELRARRNPMLFVDAKRPEGVFAIWKKFLPHRCDVSSPKEPVQLLLRTALHVGGDLDELKWHTLLFQKHREQGLRLSNPIFSFVSGHLFFRRPLHFVACIRPSLGYSVPLLAVSRGLNCGLPGTRRCGRGWTDCCRRGRPHGSGARRSPSCRPGTPGTSPN